MVKNYPINRANRLGERSQLATLKPKALPAAKHSLATPSLLRATRAASPYRILVRVADGCHGALASAAKVGPGKPAALAGPRRGRSGSP